MKRILVVAALMLMASSARAQGQGYVVVVNEANPVSSLTKDEVSKIFLKKTVKWPSGGSVSPVDLATVTGTRDAFSKAVHDRGAAAIESFWQQQIFSGKDVPPPEMASDADVVTFVRSNPAAIGYVASGTTLSAGVKAVAVR
jgi:ABC-type phosphate transport system substrate-binding protein